MNKQTKINRPKPRSVWRGVVAGLVGGLVATAAKSYFDRIHTAHAHEEEQLAPPLTLATRLAGHTIAEPARTAALESIPWTFGAVTGAAYGAAAELFPASTAKHGTSFGLLVGPLTEGTLLPARNPGEAQAEGEQANVVAGYMIYGLVAETVRGLVRRFL